MLLYINDQLQRKAFGVAMIKLKNCLLPLGVDRPENKLSTSPVACPGVSTTPNRTLISR